jgi:hypothetical protein
MTHVYRISKGTVDGDILDSIESLEAFARSHGPGRYHVGEIGSDPLPSGHNSRRWGVVIASPGGTVDVDRDPWPES